MKKLSNLSYNFAIAGAAMIENKLRAILTSLGIIFGTASVIAMLAIGKGAEQEILEKMKILGANNIIVKTLDKAKQDELNKEKEEESGDDTNADKEEKARYTPGLSYLDMKAMKDFIPNIELYSPEIILKVNAVRNAMKKEIQLVGVEQSYFKVNNFDFLYGGNFSDKHIEISQPVCVIGANIRTRLFAGENPLGGKIKCGNQWLTVVGVLDEKAIGKDNMKQLDIRDYNLDVYVPLSTMLLRFSNRSAITKSDILSGRGRRNQAETPTDVNLNQLDRIVVKVTNNANISDIGSIIDRLLLRRHNNVRDFEVVVPELLLEQEQSTKRIFNFVLGAIASISLLVGGIGIMNIMLASVMERIKEIGIRRAVGAKRADVMLQFLSEAIAISLTGGIIGIILGVSTAFIIEATTDIKTIVTPISIFISFFVSISVGLIFGITPARRAAEQDPIDLLRYE